MVSGLLCILASIKPRQLYSLSFLLIALESAILFGVSGLYILANIRPSELAHSDFTTLNVSKIRYAHESVFYRVYEVVAALSVFVASTGVLVSSSARSISVIDPITVMTSHTVQFMLFIVFIATSIQFITGTSQHFELLDEAQESFTVSIVRYVLISGQAVSLLAMAESVAGSSLVEFANWYIVLLIFDSLWIFTSYIGFTEFLRLHDFKLRTLFSNARKYLKVISLSSPGTKLRRTVYGYWMFGNVAYGVLLMSVLPLELTYYSPFKSFSYILVVLIVIATIVSTWFNKSCLEGLSIIARAAQ